MNQHENASYVCTHCGAPLKTDASAQNMECPYCGTNFSIDELLDESDDVKKEKIRANAYKEVELGKQQLEKEKWKNQNEKDELISFKKSKFSKVLIIFTAICILLSILAFATSRILAGIIGLIQIALFVVSYLMGIRIVKEKKRGFRILAAILAFVLVIPYFICIAIGPVEKRDIERFKWEEIALGAMLPKPDSDKGEIYMNTNAALMMDVIHTSEAEYAQYAAACEEKGFVRDIEKDATSFVAYNEMGYKLSLYQYGSDGDSEMSIQLEAPMELGKLQWPDSEAAKLLPLPESSVGKTEWEYESEFMVYVGETPKEEYNAYVDACKEKGFTVDYNKGDDYYYAYNDAGYYLTLNYEGNHIMSIKLREPESETAQTEVPVSEKPNEDAFTEISLPDSTAQNGNTPASFVLTGGEPGEYGKLITYNEGTEFEETLYAYYVPEGTYSVENLGNYPDQINVYSNEKRITEDGWEEPADGEAKQLNVNEKVQITVGADRHIEIMEGSKFSMTIATVPEDGKAEENEEIHVDGIRPEFKESMDSYEAFYDEYCDFMNAFASDASNAELIVEYAQMVSKALEADAKFAMWEADELNEAEAEYYSEVSERVAKKLVEVDI